ncbi:golgin candidate 6-like isoform X1 [Capsicum annuum]
MLEIQEVVSKSSAGQKNFGAVGFQVILNILKESDNVHMVTEALLTLLVTLTPINHEKGSADEVQPHVMNSDLLFQEENSISLLLGLSSHEDFYVRYYTLKVLKALLTNSPQKLTVAMLDIFRIQQLMNMCADCHELIQYEALWLLFSLNREAEVSQAEEIQKILVSQGAFEMIFSIIKEGGSEGEAVQVCLELLNILLRNSASDQALLTTIPGFDQLLSVLNIRGTTYKFSQAKTINLLSVLDIINLLIKGGPEIDPERDSEKVANKTVLVQKKVLDHLLMLGVESKCAPIQVRCRALQCIGDLIADHPKNLEELTNKRLGEEPALNSVLRILSHPSSEQESMAVDYLFKNCQRNPGGETMLASTLILEPHSMIHAPSEKQINMSFGSVLLHGLTTGENEGDLEIQQDTKTLEMQYHEKCQEVEELQKKIQADEAELNDLLECLGIEEQKVEKLSRRLRELGEDVDKLLETENDE